MRIAYFDCMSGVSGDMLLGALVDAGVELAALQSGIDTLGLPTCRLEAHEVRKQGFRATKVDVLYEPEHVHRHLHQITGCIEASGLAPAAKELACRIFTRLAEAEAKVHGTTVAKVHFHEVGAVDSIADIVGAAIGLGLLGVDRIAASPIPTGHGFIEIAHGRVSIPAPATAELLIGAPIAPSDVEAELTTPTGAAIVTTVASSFGPLPPMTIERTGWGAGTRNLDRQANVLRLVVGRQGESIGDDEVIELETNLDDISGEVVGYTVGCLLEAGALDVYTVPIQMKKNRPAVMLCVLCRPADEPALEQLIFRETGTLGIRIRSVARRILPRQSQRVETVWGPVDGKLAVGPGKSLRFTPEYESCRAVAAACDLPLEQVYEAARLAFHARPAASP